MYPYVYFLFSFIVPKTNPERYITRIYFEWSFNPSPACYTHRPHPISLFILPHNTE